LLYKSAKPYRGWKIAQQVCVGPHILEARICSYTTKRAQLVVRDIQDRELRTLERKTIEAGDLVLREVQLLKIAAGKIIRRSTDHSTGGRMRIKCCAIMMVVPHPFQAIARDQPIRLHREHHQIF
jgi:hypothetical protein